MDIKDIKKAVTDTAATAGKKASDVVNKTKIKEDLKAGKDIGGFAHLEAQETLVIT